MRLAYSLLPLVLLPLLASAQPEVAYESRTFLSPEGDSLLYRILLPEGYAESKANYPLLLFLHGAGERGDDNKKQLVHGAQFFLDSLQRYPAIVVFPQCPEEGYWVNRLVEVVDSVRQYTFPFYEKAMPSMEQVIHLLDFLLLHEKVDRRRVYLGGLSMGGMGTFDLLARRPSTFRAAFPICGGGNAMLAPLYASHTRLWIFHGGKDKVVPPENSRKMAQALKAAGTDVRYTEYPEANHNSWDPAFAEPDLLRWLFGE